jgi:hypothetical protein
LPLNYILVLRIDLSSIIFIISFLIVLFMAQTPLDYLCKKLNFKLHGDPDCDSAATIHYCMEYLCGDEWPEVGADASEYYERNHIREDTDVRFACKDGKEESIDAIARLYPVIGGFVIALNPFKHDSERERNISKWHELVHTLFYTWEGEHEVPMYQGFEWQPNGITAPNEGIEWICNVISRRVCRQKCIMLGGVPVQHYNLVARLKKEDLEVHYLSESQLDFENHLQRDFYLPERMVEMGHKIILYDLVIFDTRLITAGHVEHRSSGKDVLGVLSERVGMPHPEYDSRADYFINSLLPKFDEGLGASRDPVIILADEEIADVIRPHIEEASAARQEGHLPAIKQINTPCNIDEVVGVVNSALANVPLQM